MPTEPFRNLPLLIRPRVRGLLLLSREMHVETWLAIPRVIIDTSSHK